MSNDDLQAFEGKVVEVRQGDRSSTEIEQLPVVIVLDRLRSAHNVGNIYRLAEICGIREIITCGYTATPPHPKLAKTARGCDELIATRHMPSAEAATRTLIDEGYHCWGVETVPESPTIWKADFQYPLALILGNEALGISPEVLALCENCVHLPVYGTKNSLNVGNCAAVVLYEIIHRLRG